MATRRPIYRKQESRSISKTGLMLCMLLAGGVMLVPTGGDFVRGAKMKARDFALNAGLVDLDDCVVTPDHAIACTSDAAGTPLPVALRQLKDSQSQMADEKRHRQKAENTVRQLALEVERLTAQAAQQEVADRANRFFPPFVGDVTPTGLTGTGEPAAAGNSGSSGAQIMNAARDPHSAGPEDVAPPFSLMPPPDVSRHK
jgi:hypothetical protein